MEEQRDKKKRGKSNIKTLPSDRVCDFPKGKKRLKSDGFAVVFSDNDGC